MKKHLSKSKKYLMQRKINEGKTKSKEIKRQIRGIQFLHISLKLFSPVS